MTSELESYGIMNKALFFGLDRNSKSSNKTAKLGLCIVIALSLQ
jgi:hypothetical protein